MSLQKVVQSPHTNLVDDSLDILREGQEPSGAFLACRTFPTYRYSWFRDGAFIAQALDVWGEHEGARRFYDWGCGVVLDHATVVEAVLAGPAHQPPAQYLHTRYTADGHAGDDDWPNFQLDGFGTFLWGMAEHLRLSGTSLPGRWSEASRMVAAYLHHLWQAPNNDCWEEHPDHVHPATLAALCAGMRAAGKLGVVDASDTARAIQAWMIDHAVHGYLPKFVGSVAVDSSVLWTCRPFDVLPPDDGIMAATIARIEADLVGSHGGVHRYSADSYYGGGAWILLTAGLAECLLAQGRRDTACEMLEWIERHASGDDELAEQIPVDLNMPSMYEPWVARWGMIASPLLWSHAAYLRLKHQLVENE